MMATDPVLPPLFLERMARLLGDEYQDFAAALQRAPVSGLRVNTLKLTVEAFQALSPFKLEEQIPWCSTAFQVGRRGRPGLHPYHRAGLYYLQDPSAMAPAELLNPQPGERVLDLAAAPGGKTTHLAALMEGRGLLVANEIKTKRIGHLIQNLERWGAGNVVITNESPERLADHFGAFFDRVLVDAPCSGEGMFRKDMGARTDWSPEMVSGCALRQANILRLAGKLVRMGGYLLYSTCTFAPQENEEVIFHFLDEALDFEVMSLPLFSGFTGGRPEWAEMARRRTTMRRSQAAFFDSLQGAVRLFPHRLTGEGHFICLMKRVGQTAPGEQPSLTFPSRPASLTQRLLGLWQQFANENLDLDLPAGRLRQLGERLYLAGEDVPVLDGLRISSPGVWLGTFKKDRVEPAHPLALYLRSDQVRNRLDLPARSPKLEAYLRGEPVPAEGDPGWCVISVDGYPLGWGKRVQGLVKNHYPRGWLVNG
ncbi:MAG: RsmF rRNA methyltransferase first C-terminal domain-containing protein [Anaerolineales bacterium]|nr:RsmF rRNA methyltransferase first C-terminal domain-containing protein [Anaerolineales bacterium]